MSDSNDFLCFRYPTNWFSIQTLKLIFHLLLFNTFITNVRPTLNAPGLLNVPLCYKDFLIHFNLAAVPLFTLTWNESPTEGNKSLSWQLVILKIKAHTSANAHFSCQPNECRFHGTGPSCVVVLWIFQIISNFVFYKMLPLISWIATYKLQRESDFNPGCEIWFGMWRNDNDEYMRPFLLKSRC